MGPAWPRIGPDPNTIKEHATQLHEAYAQLQAIKGEYTTIPATVIDPIIDSTVHLLSRVTQHLREQPDERLATQIQDILKEQFRQQRDEQQEVIKEAIKTATAPLNATAKTGTGVASWAQVAALAGPPPGHITPPHTVLSSNNSSTLTAYKGREVIVKLLDHGLAQRFRQLSPSQLKNKVNNILRETPRVKDIQIVAAHQLKSGDVTVITDSLDNATQLQNHTEWAKGLGPRAEVIRTTYGAIVHGIPVNSVNMRDQEGTIQKIRADNHSVIPHAGITHVGWLIKDPQKRSSSMVIEFTRPEMANAIIYAGFLWEGLIHTCQLYDRSCRIKQCFRCYDYGHIGAQCSAPQTCGHCTGGHKSKECTAKNTPGFKPKCAVCKDAHTAWNNACPARQKEIQRVEKAKQTRNHYWPIPYGRATSATGSGNRSGPSLPVTASGNTSGSNIQPDLEARTARTTRRRQQPPSTQLATQTQPVPALPMIQTPQPPTPAPPAQPEAQTQTRPEAATLGTATEYPDPQNDGFFGMDWLQNLDMDWPDTAAAGETDTVAVTATPPLSIIPDDQPGASSSTQGLRWTKMRERAILENPPPPRRGCQCVEHEHLYEDWPVRDAVLTIGSCMRDCPFCSQGGLQRAEELRKHITKAHRARNLTIQRGNRGVRNAPGWRPAPTDTTQYEHSAAASTQP
jgi:hypothetical protein